MQQTQTGDIQIASGILWKIITKINLKYYGMESDKIKVTSKKETSGRGKTGHIKKYESKRNKHIRGQMILT